MERKLEKKKIQNKTRKNVLNTETHNRRTYIYIYKFQIADNGISKEILAG